MKVGDKPVSYALDYPRTAAVAQKQTALLPPTVAGGRRMHGGVLNEPLLLAGGGNHLPRRQSTICQLETWLALRRCIRRTMNHPSATSRTITSTIAASLRSRRASPARRR